MVVAAQARPITPSAEQHLLHYVLRLLKVAREEEGLSHQRAARLPEEPLVAGHQIGFD
jgi:hypothetical protein